MCNIILPVLSTSVHPSVYVGVCDGSATYHKWYFEVQVTQLSGSLSEGEGIHFRVGWAHVTLFLPTPTSNSSTTTGMYILCPLIATVPVYLLLLYCKCSWNSHEVFLKHHTCACTYT